MLKDIISIIALLINQGVQGQEIVPEVVCTLPGELAENSGMVVLNDSLFMFHNDSGHEPCVYLVDDRCALLKKICIRNAKNIDWEDAAVDSKGFIYLADMGNNRNNRKTVQVYKFHQDLLFQENDHITADKIEITYAGNFPPSDLMYDVESIYWHNDSLYFFSKNRRVPFDGISWVFSIPDQPGMYDHVEPMDSVRIPGISRYTSWVTSADFEAASGTLLLLGQNKVTAFSNGHTLLPWQGEQTVISLGQFSQKEAIGFGNAYIFISDEAFKNLPGPQLYRFPKKMLYELLGLDLHLLPIDYKVKAAESEVSDTLQITFILPFETKVGYEIFNTEGDRVKVMSPSIHKTGFQRLYVDVSTLLPAPYVINLIVDEQPNALIFKRIRGENESLEKFFQKN